MTDIMANLFSDFQMSIAKLTVLLDGNCFINASTVSGYSLWQKMLMVVVVVVMMDGSTSSIHPGLYDNHGSLLDIEFHRI
jgi:hypothetical protein